jgi:putative cardiolipin synthase
VEGSVAYFNALWNSGEVGDVIQIRDPKGTRASEGARILDEARAKLWAGKTPKVNSRINWSARAREVPPVEFLHDPVGRKNLDFGIAQSLRHKLLGVHRSVLVETPYLIPTKELLSDIAELKNHGVGQIQMVTNSAAASDDALVAIGYEAGKEKLLKLGVELWEFKGPETLHAKSAVLDNTVALIGSFNVDPRSQHLNTETAVAISDGPTALQLRRYIDAHKAMCTHITAATPIAADEGVALSPLQRLKVSVLKLLLPLLRGQL